MENKDLNNLTNNELGEISAGGDSNIKLPETMKPLCVPKPQNPETIAQQAQDYGIQYRRPDRSLKELEKLEEELTVKNKDLN